MTNGAHGAHGAHGATDADPWPAPLARRPVDAVVELPGSKSLTNRYLVIAALAAEPSRLRRPLRSRDTLLMAAALRALGADVRDEPTGHLFGDDWTLTPRRLRGPAHLEAGLAGTVMRFLLPVAALATGDITVDGDPRARERPLGPLVGALRDLGATVDDQGRGTLPLSVRGTGALDGGETTLDASSSSQFVSALLLAGARTRKGVVVRHVGPPMPSRPHVAMTAEVLRDAGVAVDESTPDTWTVAAGPVGGLDVEVEPDLSNAAPFLAAALVTGGTVRVLGWPQRTTQAGDTLRDLLDEMGADVTLDAGGLSVTGGGDIYGVDTDLRAAGELTPVVAAIAALATSPSQLRGIGHLRGHETDRLAALTTEIGRLGGHVEQSDDGLVVHPRPLHGGVFRTYADHRMATAGAVLGLAVQGVEVEDVDTTAKTLPGFTRLWQQMLDA